MIQRNDIKLIIAGSRTIFPATQLIHAHVQRIAPDGVSKIVCGGAKGVDAQALEYAKEYNIEWVLFPANWEKYGISAGISRNREMADYGDVLLCFWDGESPGTRNMIQEMRIRRKELHIVTLDKTSENVNIESYL